MSLYGHWETWLLVGVFAAVGWGLVEILTALVEWRERSRRK